MWIFVRTQRATSKISFKRLQTLVTVNVSNHNRIENELSLVIVSVIMYHFLLSVVTVISVCSIVIIGSARLLTVSIKLFALRSIVEHSFYSSCSLLSV